MLELLFGFIILGIAIYIAFKVFHSVTIGIALVLLVFISSYLILGSFPELGKVPLIGKYLDNIPRIGGDAIAVIKNVLYKIEILNVARDSGNNLLVTVANTGKTDASNFKVLVDNKTAEIINNPKDPLKSGQITVIQLDWKGNFTTILVQTDKSSTKYEIS